MAETVSFVVREQREDGYWLALLLQDVVPGEGSTHTQDGLLLLILGETCSWRLHGDFRAGQMIMSLTITAGLGGVRVRVAVVGIVEFRGYCFL